MISYVIIAFVAILIGMAISVSAFGTGGKRKKIFQDIYFSIEDVDGIGVLYTKTGEYSAILKMENPVQKYSANIDSYYEFNHLITALAQTLGEGYAIHKQDVFVRKQFKDESNDNHEFLSESYFKYFNGRSYTDSQTYLIITQENKKSRIFSFDSKKWRDFMVKIRKVKDQLKDSGVEASYLDGNTTREYVDRYFSMNFNDKIVSMTNFKVDEESISMGNKRCKVFSLVDVDCVSTPSIVRPFTNIEVNNVSMPVDMVSLVDSIPSADVVVYNQMFFIPNQKRELSLLDKKKNRHASMPNPSNLIAVEDIKKVQDVIARENKQLVYAHFNLVVGTSIDADIQKCTNHLENSFGRLGIHISKRAYNQLELFVNSFSDIINDLIKKVNDTEELNDVTLTNIEVQSNGNICVNVANASQAEIEYFNVALSYIIANPKSEPISDALILNLIKETGIIYKSLPSSNSAEGNAILQCLRQYWGYKNRRVPSFSIPNDLNVFQSIMSFYVKPFGYDQIERYMLNKRYAEKSYAFMLWGACLGYASLPKTFTNIIYQDSELYKPIDEYLETIRKGFLE